MKTIILDSSFIVSAVRNKIDIFENLLEYKILIPKQVIDEIKKQKITEAKLASLILEKNKDKFRKIDLGKAHVDKLIINYAKKHPTCIIATLDREIKNKTENHKLIIRNRKTLEII